MIALRVFTTLASLIASISAREVLELYGVNFELALTSYKYAAILFYDSSPAGLKLQQEWKKAAENLIDDEDLYAEAEIAMMDGNDTGAKELIDAYQIPMPSIRVFRRGMMVDYRGPFEASGIASYLREDSKPSARVVGNIGDLKKMMKGDVGRTIVLGLFQPRDFEEDALVVSEGYSVEPWGQFQASADALRGHAIFYASSSAEVVASLQVEKVDLPALYMLSPDRDTMEKYRGDVLEMKVSEWVLRNSMPTMSELSLNSPAGERFATQFFSARKLKFVLLLRPDDAISSSFQSSSSSSAAVAGVNVVDSWRKLSETFQGTALFSYMVGTTVPDVFEYFGVDAAKDLPMIVAHDPSLDHKFKSKRLVSSSGSSGSSGMDHSLTPLQDFVAGVISGSISRVLKSEPVPKENKPGTTGGPRVLTAVGSNVVSIVSQQDKDVLLEVYAPWCGHCKKLRPTYEVLGKAVQADSRIVIAKIDGSANDLPVHWEVKGFPALLWFPAKDKPYKGGDAGSRPRAYWDAGHGLQELLGFVTKESSFDKSSLRIATSEQLGSLFEDEDNLRKKYEEEDRWSKRNEGRDVNDNAILDWALGEVVFDGKRWHIALAALLVTVSVCSLLFAALKGSNKSAPKAGSGSASSKPKTK